MELINGECIKLDPEKTTILCHIGLEPVIVGDFLDYDEVEVAMEIAEKLYGEDNIEVIYPHSFYEANTVVTNMKVSFL